MNRRVQWGEVIRLIRRLRELYVQIQEEYGDFPRTRWDEWFESMSDSIAVDSLMRRVRELKAWILRLVREGVVIDDEVPLRLDVIEALQGDDPGSGPFYEWDDEINGLD